MQDPQHALPQIGETLVWIDKSAGIDAAQSQRDGVDGEIPTKQILFDRGVGGNLGKRGRRFVGFGSCGGQVDGQNGLRIVRISGRRSPSGGCKGGQRRGLAARCHLN